MQATGDDSQFKSARATRPMIHRPAGTPIPYESYPVDPDWPRSPIPAVRSEELPSLEKSPHPPVGYEEQYHGEMQPRMSHPVQPEHPSSMQSLGSSSFNSTGIPASPDLAIQPSSLVSAALPEGAQSPSATNPGQRTYAFVSLAGSTIRKRPRWRYDEVERLYSCSFEDCTKAYGTLNHLNAHVTMQKHGPKRNPSEFKQLRKLWLTREKAARAARGSARRMANHLREDCKMGLDDDVTYAIESYLVKFFL